MKVTTNTPSSVVAGQTTELDKAKSVDKALVNPAARGPVSKDGASIELSDEARLFQKTQRLVNEAPDIRSEKVSALKKSIANGSYRIDAGAIADKLLQDHFDTDFGKNNL